MKSRSRASYRKFKELILLISRECRDDPRFGSTKLNQILFFADFLSYEELGQPISSQVYRKLECGPVPQCAPAAEESLREPNLSVFSERELEIVRRVAHALWNLNAIEARDLSHRFAGWHAAAPGEEIPYSTVFVDQPRRLTHDEQEWAREVIREYLEQADTVNRPDSLIGARPERGP